MKKIQKTHGRDVAFPQTKYILNVKLLSDSSAFCQFVAFLHFYYGKRTESTHNAVNTNAIHN